MTAGEAAAVLGRSPETIRSYARRGYLTIAKRLSATQNLYYRNEVEQLKANPPARTGRPKRRT